MDIRNITISGRIGTGATTLAKQLADHLGWTFLEGSKFNDEFFQKAGIDEVNVQLRPDELDKQYDEKVKQLLREKEHYVIQSHLAGFNAAGIEGVFKILTLCYDKHGEDKTDIRIDRLANRKDISIHQAKDEVFKREEENLKKWRRLYVQNDPNWIYWDEVYYDMVVNTFALNKQESLEYVLDEMQKVNRK